jgi:RNA polymerase sigma factor (sigma-70 family)
VASDERLVGHVRAGSEAAFEVLYDRHHRGILGFCRHMLGSVEEAEDAVQHTFMAAYRDLVGSDKPIQLRPWLYTIARNRCYTILRARRERPLGEADDVPTENLSSAVERRQDLRDLLSDLSRLPEDQRAALVLAELGAVSHDEIGTVLDVPREKVKALVFQARTSLIASRKARETPCLEIREQLASLHGGALRRTTLRRHLRECPGCRAFQGEVVTQRRALAIALPVLPTLGLKQSALAAAFGSGSAGGGAAAAAGGGAAAVAGGGTVATAAAGGGSAAVSVAGGGGALAAKALVAVALVGGGTTAAVTTTHRANAPDRPAARLAPAAASHPTSSVKGLVPRAFAPAARGDRNDAAAGDVRVPAQPLERQQAAQRAPDPAAVRDDRPGNANGRAEAPAGASVPEPGDRGRQVGQAKPDKAPKPVRPDNAAVPKPVKAPKDPKPEAVVVAPTPVPAATAAPDGEPGNSGFGHERGNDVSAGRQDAGTQP